MVIGLDIDDTITRHPAFFAFLSKALIKAGHKVVIITFRVDREMTEADLLEWGIAYSELVLGATDDVLSSGVDEWKASVCEKHGVEVFFEDDPHVLSHVNTAVTCFMAIDHVRHDLKRTKREEM
ncbi:MAG: hypothetical protein EA376_01740 [Phycisphaeraceae bacterium]|nr:MAG: hypothetical protein EA376_01740 [Phycisphaeraceae bacterium]